MADRMNERISAWLDGELPPEEAREVAAQVAGDPELSAQVAALRAQGRVLARAADRWEHEVSFEGFYEKVAARLPEREASRPGALDRVRAWLTDLATAHRPALAATVATLLVIVGGGSVYLLQIAEAPRFNMRGAPTRIEDLSVENASAVVYRTDENMTVIWLTEDEGS